MDPRWETFGAIPFLFLFVQNRPFTHRNRDGQKTDPRGKVTQFFYDDATHALPNRIVVDPQNGTGTQTTTTAYDYYTGAVTSITDSNGNTTTTDYTNELLGTVDPFGRPGVTIGPLVNAGGTNQHHRTTTTYEDHLLRVTVAVDLYAENDKLLKTRTTTDMLGRPILSEQTEDGTNYSIYSLRAYDQMGKITYASGPMKGTPAAPTPSSTDSWTRITKDNAGRLTEVATFGGAIKPASSGTSGIWAGRVTTAYDGNFTTLTDQADKLRRSKVDALGRLVRVDEPDGSNSLGSTSSPVQPTSYAYDVLGNLLTVTQGSQTRTFNYDSLSRLRSALNPESGTITYNYDDNGNLSNKIDARNIVSTYGYDALNRVISRSYSDGTPTVTYVYDAAGIANSKGKLTSVSSSVSSYGYSSYDALGRVLGGTQTTDGQAYTMGYDYDLAGNMTSQTYPSGRVVRSEYDDAARLAGVKNLASGAFYAGGASTDTMNRLQYTPHGATSQMRLGNGLWEHTNFNLRLQPIQIGLGSAGTNSSLLQLDYTYGATDNNGNVQSQTITVPTVAGVNGFIATQTYTYDALSRLETAQENGGASWKQNFLYDRFGNRQFVAGTTFPAQLNASNNPLINPNNNRIDTVASGQTIYSYDGVGNLTHDAAGHTFGYDAENKQRTYDGGATTNGGATYYYDGGGQRVKKVVGGPTMVTTVFVYNIAGQLIAEYGGAPGLGGTSYMTSDTLGSPRVITGPNQAIKARHDYLPFGEELFGTGGRTPQQGYGASDGVRQHFTSKERDNETSLDYFGARYYSSTQGRFTSPDEFTGGPDELYYFVDDASANPTFYADLRKPQSLNKYQYAFNNPLRYVDPDGHDADTDPDPDPDPPQGQDAKRIPIPRGPGPTPAEAQQTIEALQRLNRAIDDALYPISQLIGTAAQGVIEPIVTTPIIPTPLPTTGTPPTSGRQPVPPPPITMGKGSTKDVRKINPGREAAGKKAVEDARAEVTRTKGVRNKTAADVEAYNAAKRALRHALDKLKKSETDARKGRGNR